MWYFGELVSAYDTNIDQWQESTLGPTSHTDNFADYEWRGGVTSYPRLAPHASVVDFGNSFATTRACFLYSDTAI